MATGSIEKVITDSGSTGIKFSDGTIFRWKQETFANGDYAKTIYWDGAFTTILTAMVSVDTNDVATSAIINNNNSITVGRRPATAACTVRCLAIGRWK